MSLEDETAQADDAQASANFGAGFTGTEAEKPTGKTVAPDPATTARETEPPPPEYVQIPKEEWAEVRAAAAKTASYDKQLASTYGTIGNLKTAIKELQSQTPKGFKVEFPKEAFAKLAVDFPELAEGIQEALAGVKGTGTGPAEIDAAKLEQTLTDRIHALQLEDLEEDFPNWRTDVGAAEAGKADPNHPFRKWLTSKDAAYQQRINETVSPRVIQRSIQLFQRETSAPTKPAETSRANARADRIREAVQPKGDGAPPTSGTTDEDEFAAGFNSR